MHQNHACKNNCIFCYSSPCNGFEKRKSTGANESWEMFCIKESTGSKIKQNTSYQAVDNSHGKYFTEIWSYFHLSYFTNHFPGDTLTACHAQHTSLPGQYCNMLTTIQYHWEVNAIQYRQLMVNTWTTFQYQWVVTTPIQHHRCIHYYHILFILPISGQYAVLAHAFRSKCICCIIALFRKVLFVLFFLNSVKWRRAGPPVQAPPLKVPLILSGSRR